MKRLLKLVAIPAVILGASVFATPKSAEAHWGYGYGYSYYRPYYSYYTPTYYSSYYYYPSYYHCW